MWISLKTLLTVNVAFQRIMFPFVVLIEFVFASDIAVLYNVLIWYTYYSNVLELVVSRFHSTLVAVCD